VSQAKTPIVALAPPSLARLASASRRLAGVILWAIVVGNAGVMVGLWLHYGGVTGLHDSGARWTSVGRITGLLGAWLALLQVLLLARLPVLEQLVGFDRLTVWHRRNGEAALGPILVHTVLVTIGYALTDRIRLWAEIKSLLRDYPHMVTATVGTGLLIVVVVTSLLIVRRRLPYELWQLVHMNAYAGIALRPPARPAPDRRRPAPAMALPAARHVVAAPLLTLGRAQLTTPAHHRQGASATTAPRLRR
jgi:DMSO/TMAO reductase YedYZ heme-binding membrane subunit